MEATLKLILKRIHWSLALKAFAVALVWLMFPGWIFLVLSFYFYFVPLFHPGKLFLPFLTFLFLSFTGPENIGFAVIIAGLFYVTLGIKDLILIDRRSAYDTLVLVLIFLLDIWFFSHFGDAGYSSVISIFLLSAVSCLLYRESLHYANSLELPYDVERKANISLVLAWFIISQLSMVITFLPINFLYQSAMAFFLSAILLGLLSIYLGHTVTQRKILMNFSAVFVFLVIILGSIQWGL